MIPDIQLAAKKQANKIQYDVVFSDVYITDTEASLIIEQSSSPSTSSASPSHTPTKGIAPTNQGESNPTSQFSYAYDPAHNTYEVLVLNGEEHLCTVPIVDTPPRNETSEAEARATEKKELARASDRGWELLQDLEGHCLFFISGWWSYSFCYNVEITQFHQLPSQPGKDPTPDPATPKYVLGRAKGKPNRHDEWGNEIELRKAKNIEPPKTELQVKGDTRYLVQRMEGGTICDLTGKPRRIEVQYHCSAHLPDRIGYIKEVTTCSYLLVVYTARLCNDVAFLPPKESKANSIVCRTIVPEDDLEWRYEMRERVAQEEAAEPKETRPVVGGVLVGAAKYMNKEGQKMPSPPIFGKENMGGAILVKAKAKADGGQVESVTDEDLLKMDIDPKLVEELKDQIKKEAKDKGWKIEVFEEPGDYFKVVGVVDGDDEAEQEGSEKEEEEGSKEVFKDEL